MPVSIDEVTAEVTGAEAGDAAESRGEAAQPASPLVEQQRHRMHLERLQQRAARVAAD